MGSAPMSRIDPQCGFVALSGVIFAVKSDENMSSIRPQIGILAARVYGRVNVRERFFECSCAIENRCELCVRICKFRP